jgi:DNA-binding CsgD family transcriptional regulator
LPATWGTIDPLQANTFVVPFEHPMADRAGLVLPVAAESGQTGLFVFTGRALQLDMPRLRDLHRDCYAAFEAIAALKSGSSSSATAISKRELECLRLTAAGRTSEDIARILGLSIHTANQYLTSAAAKLDAVNRMQAVAKAMRLGMID